MKKVDDKSLKNGKGCLKFIQTFDYHTFIKTYFYYLYVERNEGRLKN
jgi:hypothetical protein